MNKINTYNDLLEEKKQLETELTSRRAQIRADVAQLKADWKPVADLLSGLGKISSKSRIHPLLSIGIDLIGNVLIKNALPARGGWIGAVLPALARGFSTHILNREGTSLFSQWLDRFRRREQNGKSNYADASVDQ